MAGNTGGDVAFGHSAAVDLFTQRQQLGIGLQQGGRQQVDVKVTAIALASGRGGAQLEAAQVHRGGDVVLLAEAEQVVRAAQGTFRSANVHLARDDAAVGQVDAEVGDLAAEHGADVLGGGPVLGVDDPLDLALAERLARMPPTVNG